MKTLRRISRNRAFAHVRILAAVLLVLAAAAVVFLAVSPPATAQPTARPRPLTPKFSTAVAFDVSPALRNLPLAKGPVTPSSMDLEIRPERGPVPPYRGHSPDGALQTSKGAGPAIGVLAIPSTLVNFEGLSN